MPLSSAQIPRKPVSCGRVTQKVVPGCESWSIPDGLVLVKEDKLGQAVPFFTSALVLTFHNWSPLGTGASVFLGFVCVSVCYMFCVTNMRKRENKYEFEYHRCVCI